MKGSTLADDDRMAAAVDLLARLVGALELRDASDPDSPPWAAEREIRRLEREIMVCLHNVPWIEIGDAPGDPPRPADRRMPRLESIPRHGMLAG